MAAEAALGAAVQVLLQNLISVSVEQISLFRDFNEDLKRLKGSVAMIQSFLNDAEKKQVTDETVKQWLKKLEGVAYDADNVLDELHYQHKKSQTRHKIKKMVHGFFPYYIRHPNMTRRIKDTIKNLEEINNEACSYGLQKAVVSACAPGDGSGPSASLETDSFSIDPIFLARENDVSEIVKMMTTLPNDQVFSILPIVGMGGLGKSTVAKKVFNHETIKTHFVKRFWVHVSENFNVVLLLRKILTSLTETNVELRHKQVLLEKLQKDLGTERFLLVLDDVWNDSQEKWDEFIIPLTRICSTGGNGIIVTTRREIVASLVTTLPIHKLNTLSEDDCWSIIKAKAVGEGHIPSDFEAIGVSIAKRCQGLPMAAKVVGGLLRGKSTDEWLSIEKNWLSDLGDENSISKILKLSFDRLLSPSLKKCFAYCSIYPKGYDLQRERLVELWMAEGFLGGNDDMEFEGNKFFNLLLENSLLLQVVKTNPSGDTTYYNMHDLVHDLASSILNSSDQVRYIGVQSTSAESRILKEQASCVRSLLFNDKICVLMFSEFKSLHVLILAGHCVEELPSSIRQLIHLRCLDISGIRNLRCLPDSIGELYHLQTLRACYALEKLPSTMKYLISLRHLHIARRTELPPEMGRLTSLRTLPYFGVGDEKGCGIDELGSLKNLRGELEIYNLEKVHDKEEAKSADLLQKPDIVKLRLGWTIQNREGENGDESVLEGLQPHPNLKSLFICGFGGRSLPSWCSEMSGLDNLMEIRLQNCTECDQVPRLGHLPHLKNLYLIKLENVKSMGSSFYGIDKCCSRSNNTITVFPALERLELVGMSKLTQWLGAELMPNATENQGLLVVFPSLKYLEIDGCAELMSAPSHFPCLQELGISRVDSGLPLASICGVNLTSLEKLRIVSIDGLVRLPDWLFDKNQNLSSVMIWSCPNLMHLVPCFPSGDGSAIRVLEIWGCSNLIELPKNLHNLSALERLSIHRCPNLETIPYPHESHNGQLLGFSCLRHLSITECRGLTSLASEMIESCSLSLEKLELRELTSLTNMGMVIGYILQRMTRLSKLVLVDVPMNTMITTNSVGSSLGLFNLRKLRISTSDEYSHSSVVDAILKASTKSLRVLDLHGKDCSRLPEQLQHLTAVSQLCLYNFTEIEELPDLVWSNKLSSSLQKLRLSNCKKLRRLPSKEAMLRLTKLTDLEIYKSPMLNLNKSSDGDSEWPKISHITYVTVDDEVVSPTNAH